MDKGSVVLVPSDGWKRFVRSQWKNLAFNALTVTIIAAPWVLLGESRDILNIWVPLLTSYVVLISIYVLGLLRTSDQMPVLYTQGIDVLRGGLTGFKKVFVPFRSMEDLRMKGPKTYRYLRFRSSVDGRSYVLPGSIWGDDVIRSIYDVVTEQRFDAPVPRLVVYPSDYGTRWEHPLPMEPGETGFDGVGPL